jgi:hypothetical protein
LLYYYPLIKGVKSMERCPSCNAPVNVNGKFCTECGFRFQTPENAANPGTISHKPYKLRSPIFESSILVEGQSTKTYTLLVVTAYSFWLFALILTIMGLKNLISQYTIDFYKSLTENAIILTVALICFMIPGLVNVLISIDENLEKLVKQAKRDKAD